MGYLVLNFIDVDGLSLTNPHQTLAGLEVDGERVEGSEARCKLLASLLNGAGVSIYTGPWGAPFWSIVSKEVRVVIVPEEEEYNERVDEEVWLGIAVGLGEAQAKELAGRTSGPTKRHRLFDASQRIATFRGTWDETKRGASAIIVDPYPVRIIDGAEEQSRFLGGLRERVALDFEWHRESKEASGLAVAGKNYQAYLPVRAADAGSQDVAAIRKGFGDVLLGGWAQAVLHNARADIGTQFSVDPLRLVGQKIDDTMVLAYLLGETDLRLKHLTRKWLGRTPVEYPGEIEELPVAEAARYAASGDARNTYDLYMKLAPEVIKKGQMGVYEEIERPLIPVIASMEKYGVPVDIEALKVLDLELEKVTDGLRDSVLSNYGFDLASDGDTKKWIISLGFPDPGSVDQRVISKIPAGEVDVILAYRRARTLRRNFVAKTLERYEKNGYLSDFRLYPRFNQAGGFDSRRPKAAPRTGRLSSADPNLQNQPKTIRHIYIPPSGYVWWSRDYSQIELRIAAAWSGDPGMIQVFLENGDPHQDFINRMKVLMGLEMDRISAKTANFEQLFGGRGPKLQDILAVRERIFLSDSDAEAIIRGHQMAYPKFHQATKREVEEAKRRGYGVTLSGRRRYIPELYWHDPAARGHGERAVISQAIQGTAADEMKNTMMRVVPVLQKYGAHMAITVHDEIGGWVKDDERAQEFDAELKEVMEDVDMPYGIKLLTSGGLGRNWAEAH